MTLPKTLSPQPKDVTINGQHYHLVAFYYPDRDMPWDLVYQGQFLANFYPCQLTLTLNGITGTFQNAESAFQATKWWNTPHRAQFEGITGSEAYKLKKSLHNADYSYAGLGSSHQAMKTVLTQKFSDPALQQGLLLTGDAYLLEHNEASGRDPGGWSDNHDGSGSNQLGQVLMEIRALLGGVGAPAGTYFVADFTHQVATT
ncbi:MAG TPA: NADAR family protein [Ardenticatenaceae bacterium]|jgi:predicted NAD-dependent protein-ADP-ribosyltransferase YbiA (DUF1768 family)